MSLTRRLVAALLGLVSVVALLLLGPLSTPGTAAGSAASSTDAHRVAGPPSVGECHKLSLKGLYRNSDTSRKVRCSREHTSRVIKLTRLPDGVSWSDPAAKLQRIAVRKCQPAWNEALGRSYSSRALTAYSGGWFMPSAAQRDQGARWLSCHQILWGGSNSLAPLPTDKEPALGALPHPGRMAVCLTRHTFVKTVCARRHAYRGTGVFTMDTKTFPGERAIRRQAIKRCPSRVQEGRFSWTFRAEQLWELGDHTVVCYSKTRR